MDDPLCIKWPQRSLCDGHRLSWERGENMPFWWFDQRGVFITPSSIIVFFRFTENQIQEITSTFSLYYFKIFPLRQWNNPIKYPSPWLFLTRKMDSSRNFNHCYFCPFYDFHGRWDLRTYGNDFAYLELGSKRTVPTIIITRNNAIIPRIRQISA